MSEVKLTSSADLEAIYKALKKINDDAGVAMKQIETLGTRTQDGLDKVTKRTENNIKKTGGLLRRLASSLYSDFKALVGLESVMAGLKLTNQFAGSVKESIKLSDTVRRLGTSFGIARKDFGQFHAALSRGLGDIGVSSEAAADALAGLAGHGVTGQKSTTHLAKGAATLAGIGGQRGQEKEVARALVEALEASGKGVNDIGAQQKLIGEVTAAVTATGKSSTEILGAMKDLSNAMPKEMRKNVGPESLAKLATIATTGGPGVLGAIQEYLKADQGHRMAMEAQGFKPFNKKGELDVAGMQKFIEQTQKRGLEARGSLETAGFSPESAEALVRMGEKADHVKDSLERLAGASRDNEKSFKDTMGMVDAFKGSINTVKGRIESVFGGLEEATTGLLSKAVGTSGAAAVVGGGAIIASKLVGSGIKSISEKLLGKTVGKMVGEQASEAVMGDKEDVTKVFVTNLDEIKHSLGGVETPEMTGKMGKIATLAKSASQVVGAGAIGYAIGSQIINPLLDKAQVTSAEGFKGNVVEQGFAKLDKYLNFTGNQKFNQPVKVEVHTKQPNLHPVNKINQPPSN